MFTTWKGVTASLYGSTDAVVSEGWYGVVVPSVESVVVVIAKSSSKQLFYSVHKTSKKPA